MRKQRKGLAKIKPPTKGYLEKVLRIYQSAHRTQRFFLHFLLTHVGSEKITDGQYRVIARVIKKRADHVGVKYDLDLWELLDAGKLVFGTPPSKRGAK